MVWGYRVLRLCGTCARNDASYECNTVDPSSLPMYPTNCAYMPFRRLRCRQVYTGGGT